MANIKINKLDDIEELEELTQEELLGIMGGGLPSIGVPPFPSYPGQPPYRR